MIPAPLLLALWQSASPTPAVTAPPLPDPARYPFAVGEHFQYSAKLGFLRLGTGTIEVAGVDTVRGVPSFVFRFHLQGRVPFYRLNSVIESRAGVADLKSRRFTQDNNENGRIVLRRYEIFPDSGYYRQDTVAAHHPTPEHPLDDAAFLYYVRTLPLQVGTTYQLGYYFKKDKNPLVIEVERRDRMELPDGTKVDCLVVHPVLGDRGMFAPEAEARVWLTDDARRIPVQIRSQYNFGTVTLRLEEMSLVGSR